jgi:O-succinylbenzoic acid--CoA ligase
MILPQRIKINHRWYNPHELVLGTDPWQISLCEFLNNWFNDNDYIEIQTSGSTGEPKKFRLKKQNMLASASLTCNYFGLNGSHSALLCLPADYIAGKMMVVRAIYSGMNLIPVKPSADPFKDLSEHVDFAAITPYQFAHSYESLKIHPVKNIIAGGSQVSFHLQQMMNSLESNFYETYGMTETCSHIALRKLNGNDASDVFEVLPGIDIKTDARGCLMIHAPALASQELVTNDMVDLRDDKHFKWLGRFDNVINTGGIKIFPEQVEKKLEPFISRRFFISFLPDEMLNQKLILVLEGEPLKFSENESLLQNIDTVLNRFEKPKEIVTVEKFEVSTSQKILKNKILSQIRSL